MRRFIWWLRSAFCSHSWEHLRKCKVYQSGDDPNKDLPVRVLEVHRCTKCGWIWRQSA